MIEKEIIFKTISMPVECKDLNTNTDIVGELIIHTAAAQFHEWVNTEKRQILSLMQPDADTVVVRFAEEGENHA